MDCTLCKNVVMVFTIFSKFFMGYAMLAQN
jgi:hypothetical protein